MDHNELVVVSGMDCVVVVPKMGLELGELDHNEVVLHELVEVEVAENSQGSGLVVAVVVAICDEHDGVVVVVVVEEEDGHDGGGEVVGVVEVMPRQDYMAMVMVVVVEEVV